MSKKSKYANAYESNAFVSAILNLKPKTSINVLFFFYGRISNMRDGGKENRKIK